MLGQREFRSMRISSTVLRRLAQPRRSSIPKPISDFPMNAVLSQSRCPGKEPFAVCGFLPLRDWPQATSSISPQYRLWFLSKCCDFTEALGLERTALRPCFLSKAWFASGKKSCGRARASWALFSLAPCSRPGFTLPGRTTQTQPERCSSVRSLG